MARSNHDPSIHNEPHLDGASHEVDPSEAKAARVLASEAGKKSIDSALDHSVWEEPSVSTELTSDHDGPQLNYADWLAWRLNTTSVAKTWGVTFLVMLAAGPWAIFGALFRGATGGWGLAMIVVIAPVTEELMKVAVALWIVEKRPYLSDRQYRSCFAVLRVVLHLRQSKTCFTCSSIFQMPRPR